MGKIKNDDIDAIFEDKELSEEVIKTYDALRIVFIDNNITYKLIKEVISKIYKMISEDEDAPINIYINSFGGDLVASFWLINVIRYTKTPIYTYVIGEAHSAASAIFIAGDLRIVLPESIIMFHGMRSGAAGKVNNIQSQVKILEKLNLKLKEYLKENTRLSNKEIENSIIPDNELYLIGEEVIEKGCADVLFKGIEFKPVKVQSSFVDALPIVSQEEYDKILAKKEKDSD